MKINAAQCMFVASVVFGFLIATLVSHYAFAIGQEGRKLR